MNKHRIQIGMALSVLLFSIAAGAQDTIRKREVNITSTFKPTLKEAAKINMNATPPPPDTTRPRLQYNLPNQNLQFAFQPGTLKPLALQIDSGGAWGSDSYVKLGYGTLNTPYVQAGLSVGSNKAGLAAYGKHYSSEGRLRFQNVRHTNIDLHGFFQTAKNMEWNVRLGAVDDRYNRYGFEPKSLSFPEDSIKVKYQSFRGRISMHNINRTDLGISYAPEFAFETFTDGLSNKEYNTYLNLPLRKTIGTKFEAAVALEWMMNNYRPNAKRFVNNNWVLVSPAVIYKTNPLMIHAGLRPAWDNKQFRLLPNLFAEFNTADSRFSVQVGWIGSLRNSGFQYNANINPWIWAPDSVYNTRIEEAYAGFKGSAGDHLTYSAKASFNRISNQPLWINDTSSGKSFIVLNEPTMNVINLGGSLGYNVGETFSVITTLNVNKFTTKLNKRSWGLLPFEWNTNLRLQVLKDLYVNSTMYVFGGPWAKSKATGERGLPGATDLSAGLEFKVVKNVRLWAQFNNIFNNEYQRWNQYPNFGFNFLGGVVISFAQNK
jgi:hypothetical protein